MVTEALLPEQTPGAMEVRLVRVLPSGAAIEFESAPAGWLTKAGTPRLRDWRRYRYAAEPEAKALQLPSVTTICSAVLPKDGLPPWYEARGIEGALEAVRRGAINPLASTDEAAVATVRRLGLGADRARDMAADRGLNVHAILEDYMRTGQVPNPADHPEPHRPFMRGLVRWLLAAQPEPVAVELLVAHPTRGYAGRADLIARIGKRLTLIDLKTQPKGQIFDSAHLQVCLLRDAELHYGEHEIEDMLLVAVDGKGYYREMSCVASQDLADRALDFYNETRLLSAACQQGNKIQRDALKARAA